MQVETVPSDRLLAAKHAKRLRRSYGDFRTAENQRQGEKPPGQVRESEIVSTDASQLKILEKTSAPSCAEKKSSKRRS
jgi:hypothetical protein